MTYKPTITAMRGVAALMVCLFHFLLSDHGAEHLYDLDSTIVKLGEYGHYGVHVFFLISGFIIPYVMFGNNYKLKSIGRFMARRSIRLEIPYWSVIVGTLLLWWFYTYKGDYYEYPPVSAERMISHLFYITEFVGEDWVNVIFWTLAIELQLYLFLALVFPFVFKNGQWIFWGFIGLLTVLGLHKFESFTFFNEFFWIFNIGFILAYAQYHKLNQWLMWAVILIQLYFIYDRFLTEGLVLISISTLIMAFVNRKIPVLDFLGKISYSLYLSHGLTGMQFLYISRAYGWDSTLRFVLAIAITIVGAWLMYLLIEKPAIKLSKKLKYQD